MTRLYPSKWWQCKTIRGLTIMQYNPGYAWMRGAILTELQRRIPNYRESAIHTHHTPTTTRRITS